ncbi:MAG: hypothetical protein HYS17_03200 [Micavibrio aeruginosavorus]|uniref:Uncharacterized protein n=1 Tax=Micavibrio aeruginosavorus TaxID=349221 RepID=A0A7T5R3I1_9BACT|nr:MAG: hypothetical protein HYS17_03200 [Micavibrio aeruginosavorus]
MITRPGHLPLITPVAGVFSGAASDNDNLKDSERKRPEHQESAREFSTRGRSETAAPAMAPSPDYIVSLQNMPPVDIQTILTYGYDPRSGTITLQKFIP